VLKPPYPIYCLTMILFGLSVLMDEGDCDDVTLDEVKEHAKKGDLIAFLTEKGGGVFASGFLESPDWAEFVHWYENEIAAQCHSMHGRERRKYAIQNRGICLLISYTAELIQQAKDITLRLAPAAPGSSRPS
jgi:hypothetical protein